MDPILLYGFPLGSSMGLVAALEWLGQPYRLARVDMLNDMTKPEYLRVNPRGETPVLITDDERVLTETFALAGYFEARDPGRRISFAPGTVEANRLRQLIGFINTSVTAAFGAYWFAMEAAGSDHEYQTALRRFGHHLVNRRFARLEEMVGDAPYLVGDHPTLADGVFIGVMRWAAFHQATEPGAYPKIEARIEQLMAEPAVVFAQAIENGETPTGSGALKGQIPLAEVLSRYG